MQKTQTLNSINSVSQPTTLAKKASIAAPRLLLGALLLFSVANAFLNFAPNPPLEPKAQAFMQGLFSAPYFFLLLKGTEFLVALALLSNRFVPLALVVMAPITINIILFHAFLAPAGIGITVVLAALHLISIWQRRDQFKSLLT